MTRKSVAGWVLVIGVWILTPGCGDDSSAGGDGAIREACAKSSPTSEATALAGS